MNSDLNANPQHEADPSPTSAGTGSGACSILGYDYQIDVSVWLALDLVLASKLAHELILEPASEEDLEANLEEWEPSAVTSEVPMERYRLVVQAKRRTGDAWTPKAIERLLNHGEKRKPAAMRLLEDVSVRYLLVTSAGLNGDSRELAVRRAGNWPKANNISIAMAKFLPANSAGRIAIIGNQDEERLETDIEKLLLESFRVPRSQLRECWQTLRVEARVRISGAGGGRWTREELEHIVRQSGGYIASSPELKHYVHPTNWSELRSALDLRHAALIVGQSGTGKTMATLQLYEELRQIHSGLTRVPITLGPQQLANDKTAAPVLYDIIDPWGKFDFDPASRPWNTELSKLFAGARHDRLIVATSRRDVAEVTLALATVDPWIVRLEAEHYGATERQALYQSLSDDLSRAKQLVAKKNQKRVLEKLATPLEIQKFFDALATLEFDENRRPETLVDEAIRGAHHAAIEQTVINQIQERQDIFAATVIWALLKVSDKFSFDLLRQIEDEFSALGPQYDKGVSPLLKFFIAARNLRQVESTVTYYHPRVESGIEQALLSDRLAAKRILNAMVGILASLDEPGSQWGIGAAARLINASERAPDLKPRPSRDSQLKIDLWLAAELFKAGSDFEATLKLAASAGSHDSDVSEVARYLNNRPDQSFLSMDVWKPPEHDDEWYVRMKKNSEVKAVLVTFIRDVLPGSRGNFGVEFVGAVERLAPDLTAAFLSAAEKAVHSGVISTEDVIAAGALKDLAGFEKIIDMAVSVRTPSEAELADSTKTNLAIVNGEYNDEYADYLSENDEGWTAGSFIGAYVECARDACGWQHIASHKHIRSMLFYWFKAMANADILSPDEVAGAFAIAHNTGDEDSVWTILAKVWDGTYAERLLERIVAGHASESVRLNALICMAQHTPKALRHSAEILFRSGEHGRICELSLDIARLASQPEFFPDGPRIDFQFSVLIDGTPGIVKELGAAAVALETGVTPVLSPEGIVFLTSVSYPSDDVRLFRLKLAQHLPVFVADDVRWILSNAQERGDAVVAIRSAIHHRMTDDIEAALSHRFSRVVALALEAIASLMSAPLPQRVLDFAGAKGSPVRLAVVELLGAKPHADHMTTMLLLARDKWSRSFTRNGEQANHPIARAAVLAISRLGQIEELPAAELLQIAIDTADNGLRLDIYSLLARAAGASVQMQLFELTMTPGEAGRRTLSAHALMRAYEKIGADILCKITPKLLLGSAEAVASRLVLLMACAGSAEMLLHAMRGMATHRKRRVFLLLAIYGARLRLPQVVEEIAGMLPVGHGGVAWALGGAKWRLEETALDNLGDSLSVEQVLGFMQPGNPK